MKKIIRINIDTETYRMLEEDRKEIEKRTGCKLSRPAYTKLKLRPIFRRGIR